MLSLLRLPPLPGRGLANGLTILPCSTRPYAHLCVNGAPSVSNTDGLLRRRSGESRSPTGITEALKCCQKRATVSEHSFRAACSIHRIFVERRSSKRMAKRAPNPIDKHVGSRVRMRRMILAMSQEKLGDALGLTFQQVQKYEKGRNRIGASRLQHISHILQAPVSFFFDGAPIVAGMPRPAGEAPSPAYVSDF